MPRAPYSNQHDGANAAPMLIAGAPAGRRPCSGPLFAALGVPIPRMDTTHGGGAGGGSEAIKGGAKEK